ncbi:MAG: AAA family ATPase [Lachnospiraceae bacterium]|nr:AAA family ATPase [Lachnospiraceae bacterium]
MNIKEAKEYIKDTVKLYLKKDDEGEYRIPVVRQRPVFLLGAPGIGKTAIMEQVAEELHIALLSYSMTHHTRQSALGLPFISHKNYEGMEYDVSEYTMSEIISSIYDVMAKSGIKEGILFLDEINCVSETLAPSMLQFLQYKVFGRHAVPEGWVIVTAGNPPEYNKSVREFDVVTLDRLKILDVSPDYNVWKEYAKERDLHTAILNYLDINKEDFYGIETTVNGKNYITARGWEDLSKILSLYEEEGIKVEESLIEQYIRNDKVVKQFSAYYDLYIKYQNDYRVDEILAGKVNEQVKDKARKASFDERLSLMGMLIDSVTHEIRDNMLSADVLTELLGPLRALKAKSEEGVNAEEFINLLFMQKEAREKSYESLKLAGAMSDRDKRKNKEIIKFLNDLFKEVSHSSDKDSRELFMQLKAIYDGKVSKYKIATSMVSKKLHNLFVFTEDVFGSGNEMLILMTELTVQKDPVKFISTYGSEDYSKHNEDMMISDRGDEILEKISNLQL